MKVNFKVMVDKSVQMKHFETSGVLADHLLDEINLFCETNELFTGDMLYIVNKLLVNIMVSDGFSIEDASSTFDLLKQKTIEFMKEIKEIEDHGRA